MAATAATSGSISLRPELSLIVSLAHETQFPGDDYLPEELFESQAVATSSTIGKGSTFTVCRKKVHQPVEPPARPIDVNGIVVTHIDNSYKKGLPPYIVYKIAQVQFTSEGHAIAEHRSNLASAFLEIVVLTHRPIIRHPYLPLLYGFAWGHNRFSQYQRIPIPMLDWAEHGNLADFVQAKTMDLPQKRRACWEIGTALSFLHDCGIAHGDVKAENVLVFPDPSNGFLMKLSDFGLAVVSTSGSFNYLPRGTSLWAAPEIRWSNSDKVFPKEADVYSHGLLVWRIFCDGYDPLGRLFVSYSSGLPSNAQEISQLFSYLPRLIECDLRFLMENDLLVQKATSFMWSVHLFGLKLIATINQHGNPTVLRDLLLQLAMKAPQTLLRMQTIPWMIPVFENTLGRAPDTRNIRAAVAALEVGQTFEKPKISPALISEVNNRRFEAAASNSHPISWLTMRNLNPLVYDFILRHRLKRAVKDDVQNTTVTGLHLGNAAYLLSGMGSDAHINTEKALEAINIAVRGGNKEAGALVYRMHDSVDKNVPDDIDYVQKLHLAASYGSVTAYEDLKVVGGHLASNVRWSLMHQSCGIGASIFWNFNCLNGWSFADRSTLSATGWILHVLQSAPAAPELIKVNKRGDNFLHAAVSVQLPDLVPILVDRFNFHLDYQNNEGETPLLLALRSGAYGLAHDLLDRGADPSIISHRGESPFHWLISVTEFGYKSMIEKLISKGGLQTITCWAQTCDYAAVALESFHQYSERLSKGTPLHWAICRKKAFLIRLLMEQGAPVAFYGPSSIYYTALEQAAYLHEASILQFMIEKHAPFPRAPVFAFTNRDVVSIESRRPPGSTTLCGVPEMIKAAIDGSDRYSMLVRHGIQYKSHMRRTFHVLGKETKFTSFPAGIDKQGRTPLHYAASKGYHEAVANIFAFMDGHKDINIAYGRAGWTPICDAIRRNHRLLFWMLLGHGAKIDIKVDSPCHQGRFDWGLLHIAAKSVVQGDLTIARELLAQGVPLDDYGSPDDPSESPLSLAIENDQFQLATLLREEGARINGESRYILHGRARLKMPATILGRVIGSDLRYSNHKLRYLMYPRPDTQPLEQPTFEVVPKRGYTALHWSLMDTDVLESFEERDAETRDEIFRLLLERYNDPDEMDRQTGGLQQTALHIAVQKGNLRAVELLLKEEASTRITDLDGNTALDVAKVRFTEMLGSKATEVEVARAREIIRVLEEMRDDGEDVD